ncbi:MAG: hypothetical protein ACLUO4_07805 [Christensenellales bacterium]
MLCATVLPAKNTGIYEPSTRRGCVETPTPHTLCPRAASNACSTSAGSCRI